MRVCVCFCVPLYLRHARVRVLLRHARVLRVRRHVLRSWFPPTPGNPGTPPRCVCLYVYAGHDPDHRGEHGKNSWDVLKWDVLKSVGRKYEKGKLFDSTLREGQLEGARMVSATVDERQQCSAVQNRIQDSQGNEWAA